MEKTALRAAVRERLAALTPEIIAEHSAVIQKTVMGCGLYQTSRSVLMYLAKKNEVQTAALIAHALESGKQVFVPRVEGEHMRICRYHAGEALQVNRWGIAEPISAANDHAEIDLVIVPVLGFSKQRERLGHGKGYYDRFLDGKNLKTIALAFDLQGVDAGFCEAHDIRPEIIVTETGVIR